MRVGRHCDPDLQHEYLKAKLYCRHHRLRRAGLAAQREGEPLFIDRHGRIDPRNALEAFDLKIAKLPGVKPRRGAVGHLEDATGIVAAVWAQHRHLSAKQRRVLQRVLVRGHANAVSSASAQDIAAFMSLISEAAARIEAHGFALNHRIAVFFPPASKNPDVLAYAAYADPGWLWQIPGYSDDCLISINPLGLGESLAERRRIVAHEVFHCAQFEFFSSEAGEARAPEWLMEGSAEWVGDRIAAEWNGAAALDGHWATWLGRPELDLGKRAYDAIGFWALLQQSGVDVFARLHDVLRAADSGGDAAAYAAAIGGVPSAFFETWGPGLLRSPSLGPPWELSGDGILGSRPPHRVINPGTTVGRFVDQRGAKGASLSLEADLIEVQAQVSHGLLRTLDGPTVPLRSELLCTKVGGCSCPDRSIEARQVPKGLALLGFQGGGVSIEGRSLAEECKNKGERPPPKISGGAIVIHEGKGGALLGRIKRVKCLVRKAGFSASGSSTGGGYQLTVSIGKAWRGFSHVYGLSIGHSDPVATLSGPGGPFSNRYPYPPSINPVPGATLLVGRVVFAGGGKRFGIGSSLLNQDFSHGVYVGGQVRCR